MIKRMILKSFSTENKSSKSRLGEFYKLIHPDVL